MNNDKVQSIMALVDEFGYRKWRNDIDSAAIVRKEIESAIREAIAAPGVAQGWVMVPVGYTVAMLIHGNVWRRSRIVSTEKEAEIIRGEWQTFYKSALASGMWDIEIWPISRPLAAPSPTAEQRPPYCGSGHCSCIECPYGSIKGGPAE